MTHRLWVVGAGGLNRVENLFSKSCHFCLFYAYYIYREGQEKRIPRTALKGVVEEAGRSIPANSASESGLVEVASFIPVS